MTSLKFDTAKFNEKEYPQKVQQTLSDIRGLNTNVFMNNYIQVDYNVEINSDAINTGKMLGEFGEVMKKYGVIAINGIIAYDHKTGNTGITNANVITSYKNGMFKAD